MTEPHIAHKISAYRTTDDLIEDPVYLDKNDNGYYDDGKCAADEMPAEGLQMVHKGHFFLIRISVKKVKSHIKYL
jgi:hypothetical protein